MNSIFAIAKVTLVEQLRNRLYSIILFFGAAMLVAYVLRARRPPREYEYEFPDLKKTEWVQ
jgi:hypothetical protein